MIFKIFKRSQEKEINEFLEENNLLQDGFTVQDGYVYLMAGDPAHGKSKQETIGYLSNQLSGHQKMLLDATLEFNYCDQLVKASSGSKEKRAEQQATLNVAERKIRSEALHIKIIKETIKLVEDGEIKV